MNTAEKILETPPTQKTVEQWLREDVTKIYDESVANPSDSMPIDDFFTSLLNDLA